MTRLTKRLYLGGLVVAVLLAATSPLRAEEPVTTRLANGLEVVVQSLDRAPVVAIQIWVRAGSRLETDQERGITHLIEHMIFKGTPTRGLAQVAGQIEAVGGRINAYTSFDHTVYHTVLPAEHWALGLEVLGDALANSLFDPEELERERQVVLEEWRQSQDNPQRMLTQTLFETAFTGLNYRHPVIGFAETIESITRSQILAYMKKWYTADRISLVVVGDVEPQAVIAEAARRFNAFAPGPQADFEPPAEPDQKNLRFKAITGRVERAYLALAFHIPALTDPRTPAFDLLASLLGGGETARLTASLWAEKGLVNSINAYSFTPLDAGLLWITASMEQDKLAPALKELFKVLEEAKTKPFSTEELDRAKIDLEASFIRDKETMEGQASKLGFYTNLMGGLDEETVYFNRIRAVAARELARLAEETFRPENLTAIIMLPEGSELPETGWFEALPPAQPEKTSTRPAASSRIQVRDLPGGATLLIQEDHSLPLFALKAIFRGGLLEEPAQQAGALRLLASTWTRGAGDLGPQEVARRVENMAGRLSAYSGRNSLGLSGEFLSRFFEDSLDIFGLVLTQPTFPAEEVAKRRADQLAALKARDEQPQGLAFRLLAETIYSNHPYARDVLGEPESLAGTGAADLKDLFGRLIRTENLVIAAVGDVDPDALQTELARLVEPLSGPFQPSQPDPPAPIPAGGIEIEKVSPGLAQIQTILVWPAPGLGQPDSQALELLAMALSSQSGRLFIELRDKKSLAYAVAAFYGPGVEAGYFGFYLASAPHKASQVRQEMLSQLGEVLKEPLSEAEFNRAKAQLLTQKIIDRQSLADRALDLALYERLGLGYDYARRAAEEIKALTPERIMEAARRWLDPTRPVWITVGPNQAAQ